MSRPGAVLGATYGRFATIAVGSVLMARRAQYEAGVTKELGVFEALVLKIQRIRYKVSGLEHRKRWIERSNATGSTRFGCFLCWQVKSGYCLG